MVTTVHGKERMSDFDVLIDSDAFVGLFLEQDAHYQKCLTLFRDIAQKRSQLVTTNFTIAETATVLSKISGQMAARKFLNYIKASPFPVIHVDEQLQTAALKLFVDQENKYTSVFDCINVAVMHHFSIPTIFSFDKFYNKKFGLPMLTQ